MNTDEIIRLRKKLPPDGVITKELKTKYQELFERKLENVELNAQNMSTWETQRDQETQQIIASTTPTVRTQCGIHPVDLEVCVPGKYALLQHLYTAIHDFKTKHQKLKVIDSPNVNMYVRAVFKEIGMIGYGWTPSALHTLLGRPWIS